MRVAMYYSNNDVRVEEKPVPRIGTGEMLVKVHACGICGSDVMEWYRKDRVPLVLGHEIGGEVAAVGEGVTQYKVGDRISAAHHVPCNTCYYCLAGNHTVCDTLRKTNFDPGGFVEYLRLPAINVDRGVYLLPDNVSYEDATFVEPLACVLRGQRRADLCPGQSVLVIGCGIAGLLHVHLARKMGAGLVMAVDVVDSRLDAARRFGAEYTVHARQDIPGQLRKLNNGRLADLVIVCTGSESALVQAMDSVERGGTILFFAPTNAGVKLPVQFNELFWRNDRTLTTSYAGSPSDYALTVELLRTGTLNVKEMVTHRLGLSEAGRGFQLVADAGDSLKVIILPQK